MRFFDKKKDKNEPIIEVDTDENNDILTNEIPKICCIDINDETVESLKSLGFNVHTGT